MGVLNAVRKLKAERNVSIKWPLSFVSITGDGAKVQLTSLATKSTALCVTISKRPVRANLSKWFV